MTRHGNLGLEAFLLSGLQNDKFDVHHDFSLLFQGVKVEVPLPLQYTKCF